MSHPFNASNQHGTCLWCGRKLRRYRFRHEGRELVPFEAGPTAGYGERGDYGDNAFCGVSCGYVFAVNAAVNGFRLKPRGEP